MKTYTIRDIASLAGVSVTTVSRVLNHRPDVNKETREKIERIIEECHFVGNTNARGLKQSSEVIGMVIRGRSNPFLNALSEAVLSRAAGLEDTFITEYIDEKDDEFTTALRLTRQHRVKGLLFVGSLIDERVHCLHGLEIPVVFTTVNAENASLPRASSVSINDRALGQAVGEALWSFGHRNVAVFGSNPVAGDSLAMRFQGFCEAWNEHGLTFPKDNYRECRFSYESGYDTALEFFESHPHTTAVFAMSDNMAVGAVRALTDLGLRVPDDVSVIGFDGTAISRFCVPRLATVEQPVDEIARTSIHLLLDMLEKGAAPRHVLVDASWRPRESLSAPNPERI
jgi:LacI family transcriptional regulator